MGQVMEKNSQIEVYANQIEVLSRRVKHLEERMATLSQHSPQNGQACLKEIAKATEEFRDIVGESCRQLNDSAIEASDYITKAVHSLKLEEFKYFTLESAKSIRDTARLSVSRIRRVARWRRWEQLGVAFLIVMLIVLILR